MPQIFISYRRSDTKDAALTLYERLTDEFGSESVFLDRHSLPIGSHFPSYLGLRISNADVILILIGSNWHGGRDYRQEFRIMDKSDYVRKEIKYSLLRNEKEQLPVIPVLIGIPELNSMLPDDFKQLKTFNYHTLSKVPGQPQLDALAARIRELPVRNNNSSQPPNVLDQGVSIHARVNLWGELRNPYPLPTDSFAFVEKEGDKWVLETQSESSPRFNLNRYSIPTDILTNQPIEEVFGLIMEWYEIPRSQWLLKSVNKSKSFVRNLIGKKDDVEWVEYGGNAAYSILHFLILDFYTMYVENKTIGRADTLYSSHTPIGGGYDIFGHLADADRRLFGKYICSLTTNLGGVDIESKRLYYFPTVPGTNLQYVDLNKSPELTDVVYCGHVGLDRKGYHIYYVA